MKKNLLSKVVAIAMAGTMMLTPVSVFAGRDVKPTKIDKISSTSKTVDLGKKFELKVYTSQYNVEDDYFVWSSSNDNIVAIWDDDNRGDEMEFKALKSGSATVTCKIQGTDVKKTCKVTVKEGRTYIDVEDENDFEVEVGDSEDIEAVVRNGNKIVSRNLTYKSLTPSIVSVDKYGNVYGKKSGTGKIQISSKTDSSIKKVISVRVVWDD